MSVKRQIISQGRPRGPQGTKRKKRAKKKHTRTPPRRQLAPKWAPTAPDWLHFGPGISVRRVSKKETPPNSYFWNKKTGFQLASAPKRRQLAPKWAHTAPNWFHIGPRIMFGGCRKKRPLRTFIFRTKKPAFGSQGRQKGDSWRVKLQNCSPMASISLKLGIRGPLFSMFLDFEERHIFGSQET